jgi:hypothetical protein
MVLSASMLVATAVPPAAAGTRSRDAAAFGVKDCTRLNGRAGYYANPWCNAREQLAFDREEARRLASARLRR